jgi:hypothetical protein
MSQRHPQRIGLIHPRLAMTIALLPICVGLGVAWAGIAAEWLIDDDMHFFFAVLFSVPALVFYWGSLLIWWPTVDWTPGKFQAVLIASLILIVGLAIGVVAIGDASGPESIAILCLVSGIGSGVAMGVTHSILWTGPTRLTPRPIPCPQCGADLRGQRDCCCPACQQQFTLGELAGAKAVADALGLIDRHAEDLSDSSDPVLTDADSQPLKS